MTFFTAFFLYISRIFMHFLQFSYIFYIFRRRLPVLPEPPQQRIYFYIRTGYNPLKSAPSQARLLKAYCAPGYFRFQYHTLKDGDYVYRKF